ncbi:exosome complex protein LRP1 [Rhodotorula toruloides]|uniref:Exosome complex protein n=1 Tax=Rhodotorula toruloides TaxID=5286 RepID=A0A511KE52_RHOTO|nr:exosome complex protein LRP1 [Rhodotorula toruloides]
MTDIDPSATLTTLSASLNSLETAVEPLLAKPFDEVLADQDPLVQARLQVLTSYMVHDLIWVYLKTAGIEPSTHPVMQEIERLKGYFGKLKSAEQGVSPDESANRPRMQLDKSAASRFINAAISSRASVDPNYNDAAVGPSGTHTRFTDEQQEEVERLLEDKNEDEDDGAEGAMDVEVEKDEDIVVGGEEVPGEVSAKSKGKAKSEEGEAKQKRKGVDPFAGYEQSKLATPKSKSGAATSKLSETKRKRLQVESDAAVSPAPSGTSTPSGELSKKQRKKLKIKQAKSEAK